MAKGRQQKVDINGKKQMTKGRYKWQNVEKDDKRQRKMTKGRER